MYLTVNVKMYNHHKRCCPGVRSTVLKRVCIRRSQEYKSHVYTAVGDGTVQMFRESAGLRDVRVASNV